MAYNGGMEKEISVSMLVKVGLLTAILGALLFPLCSGIVAVLAYVQIAAARFLAR